MYVAHVLIHQPAFGLNWHMTLASGRANKAAITTTISKNTKLLNPSNTLTRLLPPPQQQRLKHVSLRARQR